MKSMFKKISALVLSALLLAGTLVSCQKSSQTTASIDREALVGRHAVKVSVVDSLSSLSVGNGNFAMTVDATGLQSFPERYALGVPLGTMSQWGWLRILSIRQRRLYRCNQRRGYRKLYPQAD